MKGTRRVDRDVVDFVSTISRSHTAQTEAPPERRRQPRLAAPHSNGTCAQAWFGESDTIAGMWILLIPLLAQSPADRPLLEAEQAREAGVSTLLSAVKGKDIHA